MDESIYHVLKIKKNTQTNKKVTRSTLKKVLKETYETVAFSTIPYFRHNTLSSSFCLKYYHSGNCIAMSMCAQQILKKKYKIHSFLIPATIPSIYQREGFLDISHVALCVPNSTNGFFILDTAFYFLEPIYLQTTNLSKVKTITNKNVYKNNQIQTLEYKGHVLYKYLVLNSYQSIPKDTIVCSVNYKHNPNDSWNYYITEIINPDDSIGRIFLHTRKDNFITVTDKHCNVILYIKQPIQYKDDIIIKFKQKHIFNDIIQNIHQPLLIILNEQFTSFIPYGLLNAFM
jgi:hypothetical protein